MPAKQLLGLAGIVGFLGTWELIPRVGIIHERFLPPASEVIGALVRDFGPSGTSSAGTTARKR
jgi:ABC-type nitrate/sulfonate/bicarbonate transport system permease component